MINVIVLPCCPAVLVVGFSVTKKEDITTSILTVWVKYGVKDSNVCSYILGSGFILYLFM